MTAAEKQRSFFTKTPLEFWKKHRIFSRKFVDFSRKERIILSRMETHNFDTNAGSATLAEVPRSKMVVGAKQLRKALQNGRAKRVYLAKNADPAITEPIEAMCLRLHIHCTWVPSMLDLGKACGIEVGAAAAAAVD